MDIERHPGARSADGFLAGLQAGMLGTVWLLLWMGISAKFQGRSFWTAENLMASVFYGGAAIRNGLAWHTVPGLALYLSVYCLLGALFAMAVRDRLPRLRLLLLSLIFALAWYYASFHGLWEALSPLIGRLHVERSTVLGHLIYGTFLSRFPAYLDAARPAVESQPQPQLQPESEPAETPPPAAET